MYKLVNNKKVEMTPEEVAEMEKFLAEQPEVPTPMPTPEERIAELEKIIAEQDVALMELAALLSGGM